MESLFGELLDVPVRECCDRTTERPRCCFEISVRDDTAASARRTRKAVE
jgi:hypothetical protein